jgi:hypothetical protein
MLRAKRHWAGWGSSGQSGVTADRFTSSGKRNSRLQRVFNENFKRNWRRQ